MKTNTKRSSQIFTHEGAPAKHISAEAQLRRSVMSCMLFEDTFYEDGVDIATRLRQEVHAVKPEVAVSIAIEARHKMYMRHAPLWILIALCDHPVRHSVLENAIFDVVSRADELAELVAMYWKDGKKPLPAQMKRGLARAFTKFDAYQLAKYRGEGNKVTLRDVMFLVHPKPPQGMTDTYKALANKTLRSTETWEAKFSTAGPQTDEEKRAMWKEMIESGKLGYFALLRNLRNMEACGVPKHLVEPHLVGGAGMNKILPFRYLAAAREVPQWEDIIDRAMLAAMGAMPKLPGKTVILVDVSASMSWGTKRSALTNMDRAAALAALVAGTCKDYSVWAFGTDTARVPNRQGIPLVEAIREMNLGHGTRMGHSIGIVNCAEDYDRLIVLTDEQSHDRVPDPKGRGYVINVASYRNGVGYGAWVHIDGFSEKVLNFVKEIEGV